MSGDTSAGYWLFMALFMEGGAAFFYAWHRWVMSKTAGTPGSWGVLGGAILAAALGVVFLLIGIGTSLVSVFG